ncbi:MAG TPA: polysaccharide biosynthesis tyrosine autokinase [Clostridia bacterium]
MTSFTDLKSIVRVLKRRLWLLILIPVLCSSSVFMVSKFVLPKQYEASSTIYVIGNEAQAGKALAYDDILLGQVLVKDYRELINQRTIMKQVIDDLGLDKSLTTAELSKMISVDLKIDTRIIEIKVTNKNPVFASKVANKVAEVFAQKAVQIMKVRSVEIVDTAEVPTVPVKPTPSTNTSIAFLGALIFAVGLVFLIEIFDDSIKSSDVVEKVLKLSVVGNIPDYKYLPQNEKKDTLKYEAYNFLQANVQHIINSGNIRTIMVTSSLTEEGKSNTAANLAIIFAKHGKKTLLVDCDMRKPKIRGLFMKDDILGLKNNNGFSELLKRGGDFKDYIIKCDIDGLAIIPTGSVIQNPDELIGLNTMKEFIESAKKEYDIIIFDSSSVGLVADSVTLSSFCDGVLFVIRAGKTQLNIIKPAIEVLNRVNANIIGVVLNKVEKSEGKRYLKNITDYCPGVDNKPEYEGIKDLV